jgi:hypothetical protein
MGPHHHALLARLVNQVTALNELREQARERRGFATARTLESVQEGVMVSLGEVLADRTQSWPEDLASYQQWRNLCLFRAEEYLKWAKSLLERET